MEELKRDRLFPNMQEDALYNKESQKELVERVTDWGCSEKNYSLKHAEQVAKRFARIVKKIRPEYIRIGKKKKVT